jgi:hypothetical protein
VICASIRMGRFEAVDGRSQFGQSFDEYGRRFTCMNRIQVQHVVLPSRYLHRNPDLAFSDTVQNCPELIANPLLPGGGGAARIFPLSHNLTTADSHAGTFTAACGIRIWNGGALPGRYDHAVFSCEPTGNLVHVDKLEPRGATFAALPLLKEREFLATPDDWFRPVFLARGPDGALYVADMYRKVIEHPDYLPEEIRKRTDFESGRDMGRIWRVRAKSGRRRDVLPSAAADLFRRAREGTLNDSAVADALIDHDPGVREIAFQFAEPRLATAPQLVEVAIKLANDPDPRVRFQCALTLGSLEDERVASTLGKIGALDLHDRWARAAVLSGVKRHVTPLVTAFVAATGSLTSEALDFLIECGHLLKESSPDLLVKKIEPTSNGRPRSDLLDVTMAIGVGMAERTGKRFDPSTWSGCEEVATAAAEIATSADGPLERRLLAVRFLGRVGLPNADETLLTIARGDANEKTAMRGDRRARRAIARQVCRHGLVRIGMGTAFAATSRGGPQCAFFPDDNSR